MKKVFFSIAVALAFLSTAWGQTPEEIIARMEKAMEAGESKGLTMTMDFKIPIFGTTTTLMYVLGDTTRTETAILGHRLITFSDGVTDWEYDESKNEITIEKALPSGEGDGSEAEMFDGITDGYSVSLKNETADAWYLVCKKTRDNTDKDAPDRMELVVSKKNDLPVSLSTKMKGIKLTLWDIRLGVDAAKMVFRIEDYPDAKVIDKR